jgi:hypothetical protein
LRASLIIHTLNNILIASRAKIRSAVIKLIVFETRLSLIRWLNV